MSILKCCVAVQMRLYSSDAIKKIMAFFSVNFEIDQKRKEKKNPNKVSVQNEVTLRFQIKINYVISESQN